MILICGATGLVGRELCMSLDKLGRKYIGTYNNSQPQDQRMYKVDFLDLEELNRFVEEHDIHTCIFCVVERRTDICEHDWDAIKKVNIDMPGNMAIVCKKHNIKFIHISTDYVFDGKTQPNTPDSSVNPLQNYGMSKLLSEFRVLNNNPSALIIRTPVLYSKYGKLENNAVSVIGKKAMNLDQTTMTMTEDNFNIRRPLAITDLCAYILKDNEHRSGIYHFYNPYNKYTKYEILCIIADIMGVSIDGIKPINKPALSGAPRPYDTQLADTRVASYLRRCFIPFKRSLEEIFLVFRSTLPISKNHFILMDLDGTIIDSNRSHYNAYKAVFNDHDLEICPYDQWLQYIDNNTVKGYIDQCFPGSPGQYSKIMEHKYKKLANERDVTYTAGSEQFIDYIVKHDIAHCVVTNTTYEAVEIYKQILPKLRNLNFIARDDYTNRKPHSEGYHLAMTRYYKNQEHVIGIEDSNAGFQALESITPHIYMFNNKAVFAKEDVFLFTDFRSLLP